MDDRVPSVSFQNLVVWQKAHAFVLAAYKYSGTFPKYEMYGLASQFRRAAVSIAANIAEGFRKRGKADKVRYYNISEGSVEECKYYLILSQDLEYGDNAKLRSLLEETSKLLQAYTRAIQSDT